MMKKFVAVFLMMVYGFTSMGASVTVHQCSIELKTATHHHQATASHHNTESCGHQQLHDASNCCISNEQVCTAKNDDNLSEVVSYKPFSSQPLLFNSHYTDGQARPLSLIAAYVRPVASPSSIHKVRLHLYNRILLI